MEIVRTPLLLVALGILLAGLASLFNLDLLLTAVILTLPFVLIWMVWRVLRDNYEVAESFDDRFYQDWDYRRSGREEK
ncbi:MAG: hypothetical protein ACFCUH_03145 [Flavobacteriales bacterium]|jgi:hypothetical protein